MHPQVPLSIQIFHLLQGENVLPETVQEKHVKYELDSNRLLVRAMPSPAHDAVANAWNVHIGIWSVNSGAGPETLLQCRQGCARDGRRVYVSRWNG